MPADNAIIKFLTALFEAEQAHKQTDIHKIGFLNVETTLSVFKRCMGKGYLVGNPAEALITPAGRKIIGKE